ncbi:MAG: metalloprotease [Bacteroidia bacterium]|nr:metalloprotease [Bacteroidia bacterium]NNF31047.1 metalloprotease [Flavobacteriaceae bacterium]MBT8276989.1 metalloprotease [Bacteroidia bacterium]NNJ83190.1 metalloprotease [Flavobacteriaceae bacterium]NNK53825.1 metalloprotease [Flavobacteriaceae bacterium]
MGLSPVLGQHLITIETELDAGKNQLNNSQQVVYKNTSDDILTEIYFNDWANSFATKTTPLARRFAENFDSSFHFEKDANRGHTNIISVTNASELPLEWERGDEIDILKIILDKPIAPGEIYTLNFMYKVKLPNARFTRYGHTREGNYNLRYWYLSPAVYDGEWQAYSNRHTDDLYLTPSEFKITLTTPSVFKLTTDLRVISEGVSSNKRISVLQGSDRMRADLYLEKRLNFEAIVTDKLEVITDLKDRKVNSAMRALTIDRITHFLDDRLGPYPFDKMLVSEIEYRNNPVYGLNQLPDFISPFPDGFEYDMEVLKTATANYLENSLVLHPRKDYWLYGALQIYLMMEYVDRHYPNMKIIGTLSNFWVIRWSHASELEFNDQYPLLYLNMARNNLHQPLSTPKDMLTKFNKNIANNYYGGDGLNYLSDYLGKEPFEQAVKGFYKKSVLKPTTSEAFRKELNNSTGLPVDWFFDSYVSKRTTIDFKITKVNKRGDSLDVYVRNRRKHAMPVSLYGINKDSTMFKTWIPPIDSVSMVTVPAENVKKLVLNKEAKIPEFNQRNNYKTLSGLLNRPIQFRLFQDVEDPKYNQLFFMPVFEYNLYDGFTVGPKLYNKTVLPKGIHYKLEPQYGFRSKTIVGNGSIIYTQRYNGSLYAMRFGLSGSTFSYNNGLFYRRYTPFMTLAFRQKDLRNNEKQYINLRNVNVYRDNDPLDPDQEPNYSVLNLQYVYSNPNLIHYFRSVLDYQISTNFSKVSATLEYRKLFLNNRQLNVRFFAGAFLYNNTARGDDYFSFALDRPTDYLFDYNYYGRSEDTGLFSQQIIIAEGGFKSKLQPAFANSWITTVNASTNIWKWIYAYGDAGLVHNRGIGGGTEAVFDTGVRLSLVADYFEVYLPLYSTLGWEPGLGNYDQRIRFIVTLSPKTLLGLFTREWY